MAANNEEKGSEKMDKEEDMRARMERMVEDTERMEMEQERRQLPASEESSSRAAVHEVRSKSPPVNRSSKSETSEKVKKTESPLKSPDYLQQQQLQQQQTQQQQLQQQLQQLHQLQQQQQQREQQEQQAREAEQAPVKEIRRRLGSPEEARARPARHLSPIASDQQPRRSSQRYSSDEEDAVDEERRRHQRSVRQQRRSASLRRSPVKKQIILINNEDLMEDIAKAKRAYSHRDPSDDYEYEDDGDEEEDEEKEKKSKTQPRSSTKEMSLRKRKPSVIHSDSEKERISQNVESSPGWFSWLFGRGSKKEKLEDEKKETKVTSEPVKVSIFTIFSEFSEFCRQNPEEVKILIELRNLCIVETIITLIICGLGGLAFRFTEGAFESFYKCGVKRVKRDFLDSLWNYSHNMKEDDWKSMARRKLMEFEEQLHEAHEAGISSYTGIKSWSFINSCMYCLTIISTIGYGHISPSTTTGRALTIIYAIIGIPMFLIVLADFGKLFTRGIKFLWAFVRRLYYTGSCRKVRRTVQVQEMMKGVQMVYDFATFRRPSQMSPEEIEEIKRQQQTVLNMDSSNPQQQSAESPSTPAMSTFEIDDEFNLPISVAITILVLYIFVGAVVFNVFEEWTFFESFYFVFISMSTIGFGDFVPQDPLYMMLSIVYMIFGLALTSMCINVVQVMLTDQFKQASQKIGASIGFQVSDEDGSLRPVEPIEIPEVHKATKIDTKEKIAPHAQPEEAEL